MDEQTANEMERFWNMISDAKDEIKTLQRKVRHLESDVDDLKRNSRL